MKHAASTGNPSVFRRFSAYLLDLTFLIVLFTPLIGRCTIGLFSEESGIYLLGYAPLLVYLFIIVRFLYLSVLWRFGGTPAERILKIRVVKEDGQRLSLPLCILRALLLPVEVITLGLFYLPSGHRGIHERLSRSVTARREPSAQIPPRPL